ncbi:MAG: amidohydrolase family protein [Verrucomicrobia bacterium]|jgi:cytosine/adenosine deaminase-related metal-dependent hydrolase|nr:amidohydrolase family protein [Verrucomicrobiota bacterium]
MRKLSTKQLLLSFCLSLGGLGLSAENIYVRSNHIVTMDATNAVIDGYMRIGSDGQILDVSEGEPEVDAFSRLIDARGQIVMPGFVSGHNHLWQSAFRGIAPNEELYGWLNELHWTYGEYFKSGDMYTFTLYGALDQLRHGITTTLNHTQTVPPTYEQYMEQFSAGMDAGQHFIYSYVLDWKAPTATVRRAKLVDLIEATRLIQEPHACLGFGLHGVGVHRGADSHREEVEIAKDLGLDMQIHYLEGAKQSLEKGQAMYEMLREEAGVWDGLVYAHFIHTNDDILMHSAKKGAKMIWNPLSNGRLASGLVDIPKYLEAGLAVGMGVDGSASADVCDPFQNMRMGMYALRMRDSSAAVMSCLEVLQLHTIKTAEVLEVDDRVGSLEVGKFADFLIVEPPSPIFDPLATLVFATSASDIQSVWVRGVQQTKKKELLLHDMAVVENEMELRVERIRLDLAAVATTSQP